MAVPTNAGAQAPPCQRVVAHPLMYLDQQEATSVCVCVCVLVAVFRNFSLPYHSPAKVIATCLSSVRFARSHHRAAPKNVTDYACAILNSAHVRTLLFAISMQITVIVPQGIYTITLRQKITQGHLCKTWRHKESTQ